MEKFFKRKMFFHLSKTVTSNVNISVMQTTGVAKRNLTCDSQDNL